MNVWRVEIRAGRDEIDKWGAKRFSALEKKAGDIVTGILKAIRYTSPLEGDLNRSRWPIAPVWQMAIDTAYSALSPYSTNAKRENILRDYRENVIAGYIERTIGNAIGLTAAQGKNISEIPIVLDQMKEYLAAIDEDVLIRKFSRSEERFLFLL